MKDFFLKRKKDRESSSGIKTGAGFTLIELLVVITIIGLLAGILVVNLGESRNVAKDSSIKSHLIEVAKAAEFLRNNIGSYDGICDDMDGTLNNSVPDFDRIEEYLNRQGGNNTCKDSEGKYIVISTMHQMDCWCIDWEGVSKGITLSGSETCESIVLIPGLWDCP